MNTLTQVPVSKEGFINADPQYIAACQRRDRANAALSTGDRWGEARRFSGARAGNRLKAIERAYSAWSRAYDRAEQRYYKMLRTNRRTKSS